MQEIFNNVFKRLGYEVNVKIVKSNNADFQCDDLFRLAKEYHKSPMEIGLEFEKEIKNINNFNDYFTDIFISKPGFININVSDKYICDNLRSLMTKKALGSVSENKTIVIDYGGPNVAKPLHVGHLRTAIIGQAIYNILKFKGNKVISDVHLGDIGTQMGQVIYGILRDNPNVDFNDINFDLDYLNKIYPEISALCKEDENVSKKCLEITKDLQEGNPNYHILWEKIRKISISDIKKLYDYLNVHFDLWYGESDAYKLFPEMMTYLEKQRIIKEDEGAKIIDVKEDDDKIDMPPCIIQKSDGAYLYATSDLGTIWQREKDFHPDAIIYVVDSRQSMHFKQVFRVAKKSHIYEGSLEHYGSGTVNGKDNKPFKTRAGGTLKLKELIEEVKKEFINMREDNKNMDAKDIDKIVVSILKFADLQNDLERNYIFDIKKFSEVNGKTGPYILYTYLRINKITKENNNILSNNIYNESDRALRLKLLEVSNIIDISAKERKPHHIAGYLYDLSVIANNFYQHNILNNLTGQKKDDFEIVLNFNNKVIKTLLELLGIEIPNKM